MPLFDARAARSVRQKGLPKKEQAQQQAAREAKFKADQEAEVILGRAARALAGNKEKTQDQRETEAEQDRRAKEQAVREAEADLTRAAELLTAQEAATEAERQARAEANFEQAERDRNEKSARHLAEEAEANARAESDAAEARRLTSIKPAPNVDGFFSMLGLGQADAGAAGHMDVANGIDDDEDEETTGFN